MKQIPSRSSQTPARTDHTAKSQPLNIVLVEDIAADAVLCHNVLQETGLEISIQTLSRGIDFLAQMRGDATAVVIPDLVILDLEAPDINGFDILNSLSKMQPLIRSIPIVILTGHQNFEYMRDVYPLCIVGYMEKPMQVNAIKQVLSSLVVHKG